MLDFDLYLEDLSMHPVWQSNTIDNTLLYLTLAEDLTPVFRDLTTETLFSTDTTRYQAKIISKHPQPIVLSGLPIIQALYQRLSDTAEVTSSYAEGALVPPGGTVMSITAQATTLLMGERSALNILRHLCAVATLTRQFVDKIQHAKTKILDTRKTTPGMRHMEKYAVQCGGGMNHRMGLYDALMIKDTHIDLLGDIRTTLLRLPTQTNIPVIVEVRDQNELNAVLELGPGKVSRILFDNMSLTQLKQSVACCNGYFETEASGNINLATIQAIAETGVEYASVGLLTHSAGQVDLSMKSISSI